MPKINDLTGQTLGRLTVLERAPSRGTMLTMWRCRCECGRVVDRHAKSLAKGFGLHCGCSPPSRKGRPKTHGLTGTRTYGAWRAARERCHDPKNKKYADYGGRGIRFHEGWEDIQAFVAHIGLAPDGAELDRIDCNGNYEPGNVRWASRKEQMRNTRMTVYVIDGDKRVCLTDFAAQVGAPYQTLLFRARKAMSAERTVSAEDVLRDRGRRLTWTRRSD